MKPGRLRAVRWTDMAIVFQGALHTLNPVQRVGRQIGEAIELHPGEGGGRRRVPDRVGELLELVGLPARRAEDYPHQLSGGQRQRVLIALALACDPRLLVADEPTTALDVMVQAQVLRLLRDLQMTFGLAVLFITHDLSTLAAVCRRLAVMYAGRIVEEGPSGDVFAAPAHPYTRALAAAFPIIGDPAFRMNPSGLAGDPPDPRDLPSGCPFHPRCPDVRPVCPRAAVELWRAGPVRRAACVQVLAGEPPVVAGTACGAAPAGRAAGAAGGAAVDAAAGAGGAAGADGAAGSGSAAAAATGTSGATGSDDAGRAAT